MPVGPRNVCGPGWCLVIPQNGVLCVGCWEYHQKSSYSVLGVFGFSVASSFRDRMHYPVTHVPPEVHIFSAARPLSCSFQFILADTRCAAIDPAGFQS